MAHEVRNTSGLRQPSHLPCDSPHPRSDTPKPSIPVVLSSGPNGSPTAVAHMNKQLRILQRLFAVLALVYLSACGSNGTRHYTYEVVNTFPHDKTAYCQGLLFDGGFLFESTGRNGSSGLRKVELKTGKVLKQVDLPESLFGEGMTLHGDHFYQITWESGKGHIFDREFKPVRQFKYEGEGWGLASDGTHLIMSNGSDQLTFRDPETFKIVRSLRVHLNKNPVRDLNELEFIDGEIWANVWKKDYLVRIDPKSGEVKSIVDLSGIFPMEKRGSDTDAVLNGIAWDKTGKRLFVTGKLWSSLFEIKLKEIE